MEKPQGWVGIEFSCVPDLFVEFPNKDRVELDGGFGGGSVELEPASHTPWCIDVELDFVTDRGSAVLNRIDVRPPIGRAGFGRVDLQF